MKKRVLPLLLAVLLAVGTIPVTALAEDGEIDSLPEIAFFTEQARDAEHYLSGDINYTINNPQMLNLSELESPNWDGNTIWLLKKGGFTEEESEKISFQAVKQYHPTIPSDTYDIPFERVACTSEPSMFDLKVTLVDSETRKDIYPSNSSMSPSMVVSAYQQDGSGKRLLAEANFDETTVFPAGEAFAGFVEFPTTDAVVPISCHGLSVGFSGADPFPMELDLPFRVLNKTDSGYTENTGATIAINWVRLEQYEGTEKVVSLARESWIDEKLEFSEGEGENETNKLTVYLLKGEPTRVNLWVSMIVTVDGEDYYGTLLHQINISIEALEFYNRPADDTVENLNNFLTNLAQYATESSSYTVKLAPITYEGIIQIPAGFTMRTSLTLCGSVGTAPPEDGDGDGVVWEEGEGTILEGGIDLNNSWVNTVDISFRAGNGATSALYNGVSDASRCTFYGYDVAMSGHPCPREGNVFINNKVAVEVDRSDGLLNEHLKNTFIKNETAIRVKKTSRYVDIDKGDGLTGFRITDCNFIGNGTDIDMQDNAGTFYEYRNYYGDISDTALALDDGSVGEFLNRLLNARTESAVRDLVSYRTPQIKVDDANQTEVVTNPRWMFPVTGWWQRDPALINSIFGGAAHRVSDENGEETYTNRLTADWENPTAIFASEADNLVLDAAAFEKDGEKQIDVLDDDARSVGTWSFGGGE